MPTGTAWEHLNAQGGGVGSNIYIYGEVRVRLSDDDYRLRAIGECRVALDGEYKVRIDYEAV